MSNYSVVHHKQFPRSNLTQIPRGLDTVTHEDVKEQNVDAILKTPEEMMLQTKLTQSEQADVVLIFETMEKLRCNEDFLYNLMFSKVYTDEHDKVVRLASRYLLRLIRFIKNGRHNSMIPQVIAKVCGVTEVGNLSELYPEFNCGSEAEHAKIFTSVSTAFNNMSNYIENNKTGCLKGSTPEDQIRRKKLLGIIIVLLTLHYDLSFFQLLTHEKSGVPFFSMAGFFNYWKGPLQNTISNFLNGKYVDCFTFVQENMSAYAMCVSFNPFFASEKGICAIKPLVNTNLTGNYENEFAVTRKHYRGTTEKWTFGND